MTACIEAVINAVGLSLRGVGSPNSPDVLFAVLPMVLRAIRITVAAPNSKNANKEPVSTHNVPGLRAFVATKNPMVTILLIATKFGTNAERAFRRRPPTWLRLPGMYQK